MRHEQIDRTARLVRFGWVVVRPAGRSAAMDAGGSGVGGERLLCVFDDACIVSYAVDGRSEQYALPKVCRHIHMHRMLVAD